MTLEPRLRIKKTFIDTRLDDEVILMHIGSGQVFGITDTAEIIWQELSEPVTLSDLVDRLVERFAVDPATCRSDVEAFLDDLKANDLLEEVSAGKEPRR